MERSDLVIWKLLSKPVQHWGPHIELFTGKAPNDSCICATRAKYKSPHYVATQVSFFISITLKATQKKTFTVVTFPNDIERGFDL